MSWIDADDGMVTSQYPLSAAATVDWIGGNLEYLYDSSGWQIRCSSHQEDEAAQAITVADDWIICTPFAEIPVVPRRDRNGYRALKITAQIKVSASTGYWRIYAVPGYYGPRTPPAAGYSRGYAELETDSTSYVTDVATISADDITDAVRMVPAPDAISTAPTTETPRVVLVCLCSAKAAATLTLTSLSVEEVIA